MEILSHGGTVVPKAWGREVWLVNNELYCLKELHISPGWQCSLHRHRVKDETFVMSCGEVQVSVETPDGRFEASLKPGEAVRIPVGCYHRFSSRTGGVLLEVSTHHDDEDVEREEPSRCLTDATAISTDVKLNQGIRESRFT
jgi:mannose-6-phosphate isomerase-like protein (cupin superfamily)